MKKINEQKMKRLKDELRKIWDDCDFILGITNDINYEEELDEMIEFINQNKGTNEDPSDYTTASMNVCYGEGNWEKGQLIEWVEDGEEDV